MQEWRRQGAGLCAHRRLRRAGASRIALALAAAACALGGPAADSAAAAPTVNLLPEVVGNALVGERLVCAAGSWSGTIVEFQYQWLREGIPIAAGVAYTVKPADEGRRIWCAVTAVSHEGNVEAESSNSLVIGIARPLTPPEIEKPPIVSGNPAVGEPLNCWEGKWSGNPSPTFSFQWLREGVPIAGATGRSYTVQAADRGYSLSCQVTATNILASASKVSENSLRPVGIPPEPITSPRVLGIEPARVGETLTCAHGTWSGSPEPTFTYRWVRDRKLPGEAVIASAIGSTYTLQVADQLHTLSCAVVGTNGEGRAEAGSENSLRVAGSPPKNITPPAVSGSEMVGSVLTCKTGTWTGVPTPTYAYVWERDRGQLDAEAIGSASTYVVAAGDRGHSLSCEVTASNVEGSATQPSSNLIVIPKGGSGAEPKNELPPKLTGEPALGARLSCSEGAWTGNPAPTLLYAWQRDGSLIASATASSYTIVEADLGHALTCQVTAVNEEGLAMEKSNTLAIPGTAPHNVEEPLVSGKATVGETLSCLRGGWTGAPEPAFTYAWLRDGAEIPSATNIAYTVTAEDRGRQIACRVTAHNSAGTAQATSENALHIPGQPPHNTRPPELSGAAVVGQTLTCSRGVWTGLPAPSYSYQWELEGAAIPGATAETFVVVTADRGLTISCAVTATNLEGSETASSEGVHIPGSPPVNVAEPQVSGTGAVGGPITCERGVWNGQPPPTFTYEWQRDGLKIPSTTGATYTVEPADLGHRLACVVTATNGEGTAKASSRNAVTAIPRAPSQTQSSSESTFPPPLLGAPAPTAGDILAQLRTLLKRVQHGARVSRLRKSGQYSFSFTALAAGRLQLTWREIPRAAQHSATSTPTLLAHSSTTFEAAGTKAVNLRLTTVGLRMVSRNKSVLITLQAAFVRPNSPTVSRVETVLVSH